MLTLLVFSGRIDQIYFKGGLSMTKTRKILISVLVIFLILMGFLFYMGFFKSIEIKKSKTPTMILVYQKAIGPYPEVADEMNAIYDYLSEEKIDTAKGFGIYFDNPEEVEKEKLRAAVGVILPEENKDKIVKIMKKYNVQIFPEAKALYAEFPYKNTLSYMFGPMKVYPKFMDYMKENEIKPNASIEIYDMKNSKIEFYIPTKVEYKDLERYFGFSK